jgi:hypothetical protein
MGCEPGVQRWSRDDGAGCVGHPLDGRAGDVLRVDRTAVAEVAANDWRCRRCTPPAYVPWRARSARSASMTCSSSTRSA